MRRTKAFEAVAVAIMQDPNGRHWGYNLGKESGVKSGVLYPMLTRMLALGWLVDGWEDHNGLKGRPPRRYYELTDLGRTKLADAVPSQIERATPARAKRLGLA